MTSLPHPIDDLRDGAVGFYPDGSAVELPTATRVEVLAARDGFASVTLTRFFRCCGTTPVRAVLAFLSPPNAMVKSLTVRVGKRVCVMGAETDAEAPHDDDGEAPAHCAALREGVHIIVIRLLRPQEEVEVTADLMAPLTLSGRAARLQLPLRRSHAGLPVRETASSARVEPSAVVIVSPTIGAALLHGKPLGLGPAMIGARRPVDLLFTEVGQEPQRISASR